MSNFNYKAISTQGKKMSGVIKASDETSARKILQRQQFTILSIKGEKKNNPLLFFQKRVSLKDKIIFTEQLGVMIKSGLSVVEALRSLGDESSNRYFRQAITDIRGLVEGGISLSDALAKYPKIFPEVYVEIVRSGEMTGGLDSVLKRLAVQLEKDAELISKVKGAMIYPIIVTALLLCVIVLIITYIIPKLKGVFTEAGIELPLATKILLALSDFSVKYFWLVIILIFLTSTAFRYLTKKGKGQRIWHSIKLRLPVFGNFSKKIILARFTQTFSSLSGAGVPVLKIFQTSQSLVGNVIIREELAKIEQEVKEGVPISFAFRKSQHFPAMIAQLTSVGEKSGEMQEVFMLLADFYDKEVDNLAKNLSSALEPLIMIFMGIGVGFILMAVLQPIYGLVSAF